jgi:hypothetical protein
MKREQQSKSNCQIPHDKGDHKHSSSQPRALTWKQLQLAKFIAQEEVAEFEAVVQAIKTRQYKQVDTWKAEAGIRAARPPRLDPTIAEILARQKARLGW